MELRERYDPEDIETLLSERGYDELLEEERAYVLRHLSGREEYEAMRTLLLHMREEPRQQGPASADPQVRTAVLDAFRSRQRPYMTIWLNSIAAALWPKEAAAMWRPALALASVALLLVGGWWFVQRTDLAPTNELAELKQEEVKVEEQAPPPPPIAAEEPVAPVEFQNTVDANAQEHASRASGLAEAEKNTTVLREEAAKDLSATRFYDHTDQPAPPPVAMDLALEMEKAEKKNEVATGKAAELAPSVPGVSRTVTSEDMARNYSITNSSTDAVMKESRAKANKIANGGGRNLADDEVLLSLLNTGW